MFERSPEEMQPVVAALRNWALGHPKKDQWLLVMRGRAFTPVTFYEAVRDGSSSVEPFISYLFREADKENVAPKSLIDRETFKRT